MSFMVVTLTQEGCRDFTCKIFNSEDEAIQYLVQLLEQYYYQIMGENPTVFPLLVQYVKEDKRLFDWLEERKGYAFFAWIVTKNEKTNEFEYSASDEFLNTFSSLYDVFEEEIQADEERQVQGYRSQMIMINPDQVPLVAQTVVGDI